MYAGSFFWGALTTISFHVFLLMVFLFTLLSCLAVLQFLLPAVCTTSFLRLLCSRGAGNRDVHSLVATVECRESVPPYNPPWSFILNNVPGSLVQLHVPGTSMRMLPFGFWLSAFCSFWNNVGMAMRQFRCIPETLLLEDWFLCVCLRA